MLTLKTKSLQKIVRIYKELFSLAPRVGFEPTSRHSVGITAGCLKQKKPVKKINRLFKELSP